MKIRKGNIVDTVEDLLSARPKKINDKKNGIVDLTTKQLKKYKDFYLKITTTPSIQLCMRGENVINLNNKLELNSCIPEAEFYRRIFMLGDKSKTHFLCNFSHDNPHHWSVDLGQT